MADAKTRTTPPLTDDLFDRSPDARAGEVEADLARRTQELQDVHEALRAANERLAELERERERRHEQTALLYAISDTSTDVIFAKDHAGRMRSQTLPS